ncbi:tyrosine-type recombinase/integrase [Mycolicibacterium sp.]|uniref:tyrosine-type recombinase/integrase n=1 Tax=Mycolicibacterium sp. TaxID=2320850 RepID=UPI003D0D6708
MIEARTGPNGSRVYRARVYYRGRYVASRTFSRKRDAQEWERKQVDTLKTGTWADPRAGEKPVREWCDIWLAAQPARAAATERKIRGVVTKQIAGTFGRRPLVSVRPSEVQAWAADISRKQSAATARHSLGVLRRVFDHAVRDGAIHRNPAAGIRLPKVQGNDPRPLTHDELWRLADHLDELRDRVLVLVAGYCGLRWGELAALRWSDVDLGNKVLRISRAYSEEAPRGEMSPVKDHQARTVPIPGVVSDELAMLSASQKSDGLVFPSASNTPLRNRNFRRDVFDDAVDALGLDITPHNLRDTAASLAIQSGASVVAVARLLGHESAATTLNHYAGLFPSDLDDVAQRLDAAARRVQQADNRADDGQMDQKRRWVPANEATEILNSTPVDDGLHEDIYGPAEPGDDGEQSGETDYLLRAPENARRLLEAVARDKASQPAPSDASEAPTKHRPEGSDEQ